MDMECGDVLDRPGCPICMENYSDTRYPVVPMCGHSICKNCADILKSSECTTCNTISPCSSDQWNKNFKLIESIHVQLVYEAKIAKLRSAEGANGKLVNNNVESGAAAFIAPPEEKNCATCDTTEGMDRMSVCMTCADGRNPYQQHPANMTEEQMRYAMFCARCCIKTHSGHRMMDYKPWRRMHKLTSTVANCKSAVVFVDGRRQHEVIKGKNRLGKWKELIEWFRSFRVESDRAGDLIAAVLQMESDVITHLSEEGLASEKKYFKVLEDSVAHLGMLKDAMKFGIRNIETSDLLKVREGAKKLLEAPSEVDLLKRDYDDVIQQLAQKSEDFEALKEHALCLEKMQTVCVYYCRRLWTISDKIVNPNEPHRLYFIVTHPMTMMAVEMFCARTATDAMGHLAIHSFEEGWLFGEDYPLWKGEAVGSTKIQLKDPMKLVPGKHYVMELAVNNVADMYNGGGAKEECEVSPGQMVRFQSVYGDDKNSATADYGSQFPGFYFSVGQ